MSQLMELIDLAEKQASQELIFHPDSTPRIRKGRDLVPLENPVQNARWTLAQQRQVLFSFLTEEEKDHLMVNKFLSGSRKTDDQKFNFHLFMDKNGLQGEMFWNHPNVVNNSQWGFCDNYIEPVWKKGGFTLIAGAKRSGRTSAMQSLIYQSLQKRNSHVAVITNEDHWDLQSSNSLISYFDDDVLQNKNFNLPDSVELVVVDTNDIKGISLNQNCSLQQWCDEGRSVMFSLSQQSLRKSLEFLPKIFHSEIFELMNMALFVKRLPSVDGHVGTYELVMGNQTVKEHLMLGQYSEVQNIIDQCTDKKSHRSLNQNLLQLVLKRKIELKVAFEDSYNPEELDLLLKKIGI